MENGYALRNVHITCGPRGGKTQMSTPPLEKRVRVPADFVYLSQVHDEVLATDHVFDRPFSAEQW
ncbi:hypothetical protein QTP88_012919 [Uroleucon formosanum]